MAINYGKGKNDSDYDLQMFLVSAAVQQPLPDDKTIVLDILIRIHRDGDERSLSLFIITKLQPSQKEKGCNTISYHCSMILPLPDQVNRISE